MDLTVTVFSEAFWSRGSQSFTSYIFPTELEVRCFTHVTLESYGCKTWNSNFLGISQANG